MGLMPLWGDVADRNTEADILEGLVDSIKYFEAAGLLYVGTTPVVLPAIPLLPIIGVGGRLFFE